MGKDLRGKELGIGISQRQDGLYTARFTSLTGKRKQKYFKKLSECRQWLADAEYEDEHGNIFAGEDMLVDEWFNYWIENIKSNSIRKQTVYGYVTSYKNRISPVIGKMKLKEVLPLHCQMVLNDMKKEGLKESTINLIKNAMSEMFKGALENELIRRNPVTSSVRASGKESVPKKPMTREEQRMFLQEASNKSYYLQYVFVLQTGIRVGELIALTWDDVDWDKKTISINKSMEKVHGEWIQGKTKTKSGVRTIPLTSEAITILKRVKEKQHEQKIRQFQYGNLVFTGKDGGPVTASSYDNTMHHICKKVGIRPITMHILRHTFASRCIEAGMNPKTLQELLGHASISTTMDVYVHIDDDEKKSEMDMVQSFLVV